jgi:hypothetical protein
MKTTSKSLNSYIKKRTIEIKRGIKELTGKYELPPKWLLIERLKATETGYVKHHFDSRTWFDRIIINVMIVYGFKMQDIEKALKAYDELDKLGKKGERYICLFYEDDKFVLRLHIEPKKEKYSDEPEMSILQVCSI